LGDQGVNGRVALKRSLKKWDVRILYWIHLTHAGPSGGFFEHDNETLGSMKGEKFVDQFSPCHFSRNSRENLIITPN
jgi:hypothetical protein